MVKITHCPTINKTKDRAKVNKRRGRKVKAIDNLAGWSCDLCRLKAGCKALCPPMEWIVQQVEVDPVREWIPTNPDYELEALKWPESQGTTENVFLMFFIDRMEPREIAKQLFISTRYVYKIIAKSKELIIKNLRKSVQ